MVHCYPIGPQPVWVEWIYSSSVVKIEMFPLDQLPGYLSHQLRLLFLPSKDTVSPPILL